MPCFCLHLFTIPVKVLFEANFSFYFFVFKHEYSIPSVCHIEFISGIGLKYSFLPCTQNLDMNFVYLVLNCDLFTSLITRRLKLESFVDC